MNARGKTTPTSTAGSFKPSTGARSRVTPPTDDSLPQPFAKGASVILTAGGWAGKTGVITRVKSGGRYHVRVPFYVGTIEFNHDEMAATPDDNADGAAGLTAGEQTAADWFRSVEGSAVDTLTSGGMIPVGRNGFVDGEAVIRYRIGGQLVDVCIEDYGDSSCARAVPVNPNDQRSMSTQSDADGIDLDTWWERHGDGNTDPDEIMNAATDLSWAVGHAERAIGNDALLDHRGF